ncbi:MAG: nitroreductase family protein [Methanomethylophilus sp.]
MNFDEIAKRRQSCRSFDPARPAEPEAVEKCLRVARLAPSACNAQPFVMWLVTGKAAVKIAEARSLSGNRFLRDCTTFVIFSETNYNASAKLGSVMKSQDYRSVDIGIAASYLTAEATELGLDSCLIGLFDEKKVKVALKIKGKERIRLIVALGHAIEGYPQREKKRKDPNDLIKRV